MENCEPTWEEFKAEMARIRALLDGKSPEEQDEIINRELNGAN